MDSKIGPLASRYWKCAQKIWIYSKKTIFTVLVRILLNFIFFSLCSIYILSRIWVEITLFCFTSNRKLKSFLKHCSPLLRYKIVLTASISCMDIKLQLKGDLVSKVEQCLKKTFPFSVWWFSVWCNVKVACTSGQKCSYSLVNYF